MLFSVCLCFRSKGSTFSSRSSSWVSDGHVSRWSFHSQEVHCSDIAVSALLFMCGIQGMPHLPQVGVSNAPITAKMGSSPSK